MKSKTHKISIPTILKIGKDAFKYVEEILHDENIEDVMFILDENMYKMLHENIEDIIKVRINHLGQIVKVGEY